MLSRFALLFVVYGTLLLSACSPIVETRGNLISDLKYAEIQPMVSTRADVSQKWGPPTVVSTLDPNTWYYIGETTAQKGIYAPAVQKRRMICVKFDPATDTVASLADIDPKTAKNIDPVDRKTPTAGKEYTVLQQFIGNLGKYNTDTTKKQ